MVFKTYKMWDQPKVLDEKKSDIMVIPLLYFWSHIQKYSFGSIIGFIVCGIYRKHDTPVLDN